ncbi:MAG TPA: TMEM165/GDT1 family protein [Acidimicrobiales bacterium]|nr:TMEM165/GDT1 family protein [Acidimicrobiales bacterium]
MESLLAALGLVFVAELGDKTQLVALGFGARHRLRPVLLGVAIAYAASNLLSVVVGGLLGVALPVRAIGIAGGLLFLGFAAWTVRDADAGAPGEEADVDGGDGALAAGRSIVLSVATAMFLAELGDKTMLATATLAAQGSPLHTWIGATVGIILSGMLGVLVGRLFGARLPERVARLGSAALFALFGAVLLAANLF